MFQNVPPLGWFLPLIDHLDRTKIFMSVGECNLSSQPNDIQRDTEAQ